MIFTLKVKPNSRNDKIYNENGVLTLRIHAQATEGKANKAVIEFLSTIMDVPKSYIEIIGGLTSSNKKIAIADEYNSRVEKFLGSIE
jgi:uncharacterized protein (TIGR00251 family)